VFYRNDHIAEFDAIWATQARYHKELTAELQDELRDIIIYYQRPLKSKKNLISICELEQKEIEIEKNGKIITKVVGNKVIPRSSLLFQEFKVWQTLNNVVVSLKGVNKKVTKSPCLNFGEDELYIAGSRQLTADEKALLAEELQVKGQLTKSEVISLLFGSAKKLDLNYKVLDGDKTMSQLYVAYSKILELSGHVALNFNESAVQIKEQAYEEFKALGWNTDILDFDSSKVLDSQGSYRLWHLLYSYADDSSNSKVGALVERISEVTGIAKEYCDILSDIAFIDDYGNLSAKAIKRILPYMKEGNQYDVACLYAGYKHSKSSLTKDEIARKQLKEHLEILPKNSLRNPIVEKILNQMTNVVNALVDEYGAFDEIRVELARELKKSATERKQLNDSINALTRENEVIRQTLIKEFNIAYPSRNDIIRYKLYEELKPLGYHTLYSNKYIRKEQLFSKDIDIEHIIPQARILDDSISNKTLEFRDVNIEKGNSTAYDYVKEKYGEEKIEEYAKRCEECFKDKKTKLRKLMMSESEIPSDFVERDLRNTQYISKKALSMLSSISRRVVATSGTITSKLREDWQLIDVMKEINWAKYESLGLVEYHTNRDGQQVGQIKDWTKRNDHRHHAVDALTVAFTKDVYIQYFNNKNASDKPNTNEYAIRAKYIKEGKVLPPMPLSVFRTEAKKHIENILVSVKAKNKVVTKNVNKVRIGSTVKEKVQLTPRGQLHNETIYGSHYEYECKEEKVGATFNEEKILTVCKGVYRDALLKRLNENGGDAKKAFSGKNSLDKRPIWIDAMHTLAVPSKVNTVQAKLRFTVRKPITEKLKISKVVDKQIRKILEDRVNQYGTEKDAFSNLEQDPIWLNKEKGIKIKRVTIYGIADGQALREKRGQDGTVLKEHLPVDYVSTSNNHHIAIYRKPVLDKQGAVKVDDAGNEVTELVEVVVSFYEAVARAIHGLPIVNKEYRCSEGWKFLYSMKQNEIFVFPNEKTGFDPHEIDLLDSNNRALISPNLYRVQKISSKYYNFRHHLDTTVEENKELRGITWNRIQSLDKMDKIVKVRINHIGQIVAVGEY
jgi:CRISPR-associated endonuclease Csn1